MYQHVVLNYKLRTKPPLLIEETWSGINVKNKQVVENHNWWKYCLNLIIDLSQTLAIWVHAAIYWLKKKSCSYWRPLSYKSYSSPLFLWQLHHYCMMLWIPAVNTVATLPLQQEAPWGEKTLSLQYKSDVSITKYVLKLFFLLLFIVPLSFTKLCNKPELSIHKTQYFKAMHQNCIMPTHIDDMYSMHYL